MRRWFSLILFVCLCASVFVGCENNEDNTLTLPTTLSSETQPEDTAIPSTDDHVDETQPIQPAQDALRSVLLEIEPWSGERAGRTSSGNLWETENGYYYVWRQILYYADRSDLSNWIPVCTDPECDHDPYAGQCSACVPGEFVLKGDRIYFNTNSLGDDAAVENGVHADFLASMALDGTDRQVEYVFEEIESLSNSSSAMGRLILTPDYAVYIFAALNPEGQYDVRVCAVDESGTYTLLSKTEDDVQLYSVPASTYGDPAFLSAMISGNSSTVYRLRDGALDATDFSGFSMQGAYLSGDSLRVFRANDGYYAIDLTTGDEVKLADAQLDNSCGFTLLENCILESTFLGQESLALRSEVETHAMRFFNGEEWMEVTLPEEIINIAETTALYPVAVTSDRIIFNLSDWYASMNSNTGYLYQILLGTDSPTLEYIGTIGG